MWGWTVNWVMGVKMIFKTPEGGAFGRVWRSGALMGVLQTRRGGGIPAHKESRGFPRQKGIPCFFLCFFTEPLDKTAIQSDE